MSRARDEQQRRSPYRGLEPFDEGDAAYFFGRERETRLIAASLFAAPLTLLYGPSGVGKSSVLRAGVLPQLRERRDLLPVVFPLLLEGADGSSQVRGWQVDPLGGVREAAAQAVLATAGSDAPGLQRYHDAIAALQTAPLGAYLDGLARACDRRLMLILDQFEEYSLYHPQDEPFAEQLPGAIVPGNLGVSFLLSLREDALARLDRFKGRIPTLWNSYRRVEHLGAEAARQAIRRPLAEYRRRHPDESGPAEVEEALIDAVLREVQTERVLFDEAGSGTLGHEPADGLIETPYLQLVMTRLWEREVEERSPVLRLATLQSEGGAAEIVRTHLDRVMAQFDAEERELAARVFHRLVTPSGAKIAFSVSDLAEYEAVEPQRLAPILRRLEEGSRRILRRVAARSTSAEEPRYEIFHDRLGRAILAWRARQLQEHARAESRRHEAEQRRVAVEAQARLRESLDAAMERLGPSGKAVWARMMFYLVSTDGRRLAQSAAELAELSAQPPQAVLTVLAELLDSKILRVAYAAERDTHEQRLEVSSDGVAAALLQWHSQYLLKESRGAVAAPASHAPPVPVEAVARPFPYRLVAEMLHGGRVVPYLGSGASLSARPQGNEGLREKAAFTPSYRELKEMLARECDFPAAEFEASDLAEVASLYLQRLDRPALDQRLQQVLGRPDYAPSATHRLLAEVATRTPLLILTTNYDTLMERALDERQVPYDVLAYATRWRRDRPVLAQLAHGESQPRMLEPDSLADGPQERTRLLRLHGPLILRDGQPIGSYVLSEEDQIDWVVALLSGGSALPPSIRAELQRSHLLSLGHSARDWTQRALLRSVYRDDRRRTRAWAVSLNPAQLSVMTWQRYGVEVFGLDLNDWAAQMRAAGGSA